MSSIHLYGDRAVTLLGDLKYVPQRPFMDIEIAAMFMLQDGSNLRKAILAHCQQSSTELIVLQRSCVLSAGPPFWCLSAVFKIYHS